ncbi:MAG: DUF1961 family protein [Bacteroides sp.]|nr:DUF1961 family protein [Bacteroides sp.]
MLKYRTWILLIPILLFVGCKNENQLTFKKLNASTDWNLKLDDDCTANWQDNWFLDGQIATLVNSDKGMNFSAGPVNRDDAHHAVLWTREVFKGDIKIEYNYTRTDTQLVNVNILYIQASGIGVEPYDSDISKWNYLRTIPTMSIYYNNMRTLHISYSAFKMVNDDPEDDYIRIRKYPVTDEITFDDMEILPAYFKTGLFLPGETYKICVIKTGENLFFHVKGEGAGKLYSWVLESDNPITEGRIGLRHMYTRSANYSDFKVYLK